MPTIARVKVVLGGSAVTGPGVSTFYTTGAGADLSDALQTFYNAIKGGLPTGLTILVQAEGESFDSATGAPAGTWSGGSSTGLTGGATGSYAQGVGGRIVWGTNGVTNNRRVRGSTYIVPLGGAYYSADGSIDDTFRLSAVQNAINAFRSEVGPAFVIWTRPSDEASGVVNSTTSGAMSDRVSWLRSRRS